MTINLSALPSPEAIEGLSAEAILAEFQADLIGRFPAIEPTLRLESALANELLEASSYRETLVRARINDALRSRLLAFAAGGDLDHLAAFYEVVRLPGETDAAFRERVALENKGRSTGGSKYWYEAAARRADVRVKSATVYRDPILPIIRIAVLSTENGGIPTAGILEAVSAVVQSDMVRLVNDTVIVEAAVSQGTDVEADVWLLPTASSGVLAQLEPALRAAWAGEAGVGFDLEPSWLRARLHLPGVKRVDILSPFGPVVVPDGTAVALGTIKINFKGYDF